MMPLITTTGTGSIGNYMNYVKVMPVDTTPGIALGSRTFDFRSTLLGERAEPGRYVLRQPRRARWGVVGQRLVLMNSTNKPAVSLIV